MLTTLEVFVTVFISQREAAVYVQSVNKTKCPHLYQAPCIALLIVFWTEYTG